MSKTYNNYPMVFIHGLIGWGSDDKLNKYFPYFGLGKNNIPHHLEKLGYECYTPTLGPFNSVWDRACIFWAWLFGGTVDFGKVHSEKYGHARYGKTFEHGAIEDLGKDGDHKKINILGHSFGGPTVIMIASLFEQGSQEERDGTDPSDLSPLFAGGHGHLLHTVTTLSGVNNGTTVASASCNVGTMDLTIAGIFLMNGLLEKTPIMQWYDINLHQFGPDTWPDEVTGWEFQSPLKYLQAAKAYGKMKGFDNTGRELSVETAQEEILPTCCVDPHAYYFAQRAFKTRSDGKGHQVPDNMTMVIMCNVLARLAGRYTTDSLRKYGVGEDQDWFRSDGWVNLKGQSAPLNQPSVDADGYKDDFKPGLWYNMPAVKGSHVWWNNYEMQFKTHKCLRHYEKIAKLYRELPDAD